MFLYSGSEEGFEALDVEVVEAVFDGSEKWEAVFSWDGLQWEL